MTDHWDNEGGAMAHIRKGHAVIIDDLCFEYHGKMAHVYGRERRNHVASFTLVPPVNTIQDFEVAISWWLYDNDMRF